MRHDARGAILPIGYWHGFPRSLSRNGRVLVRHAYANVIGYISMDMVTVALPKGSRVKVGDVVTLLGHNGSHTLNAYEVARRADMIHYELLTTINPHIVRRVV